MTNNERREYIYNMDKSNYKIESYIDPYNEETRYYTVKRAKYMSEGWEGALSLAFPLTIIPYWIANGVHNWNTLTRGLKSGEAAEKYIEDVIEQNRITLRNKSK